MRRTVCLASVIAFVATTSAHAATHLRWMGHGWTATNGPMAGVVPARPANVRIDAEGHLHLTVAKKNGGVTGAELFSDDDMGFGTYQWQVQGAVDALDRHVVLGLFPYGPVHDIGVDGENEIDVEFSKWGNTLCDGACNAGFTVYPATGQARTGPAERDFKIDLRGGELVTARVTWRASGIVATIMAGPQRLGTTRNVLKRWSYNPRNPAIHVPQQPVPVGMNFWCYKAKATSSQHVVIRSFQYASA